MVAWPDGGHRDKARRAGVMCPVWVDPAVLSEPPHQGPYLMCQGPWETRFCMFVEFTIALSAHEPFPALRGHPDSVLALPKTRHCT